MSHGRQIDLYYRRLGCVVEKETTAAGACTYP